MVSPQFHVKHEDFFETITGNVTDYDSPPSLWQHLTKFDVIPPVTKPHRQPPESLSRTIFPIIYQPNQWPSYQPFFPVLSPFQNLAQLPPTLHYPSTHPSLSLEAAEPFAHPNVIQTTFLNL